jgi:hypothetical protein
MCLKCYDYTTNMEIQTYGYILKCYGRSVQSTWGLVIYASNIPPYDQPWKLKAKIHGLWQSIQTLECQQPWP